MFCKQNFIVLFLFIFIPFCLSAQEGTAFATMQPIKISPNETNLIVYNSNDKRIDISIGDFIPMESTILTEETQQVQLVLLKNNIPTMAIIMSEATDLYFAFDIPNDIFCFNVNYGRVRFVSIEDTQINVETPYSKIVATNTTDFGLISIIQDSGNNFERIYTFSGNITCQSKTNIADNEITVFDSCDNISSTKMQFTKQELLWWQDTMLFDIPLIPHNIKLALEYLEYPEEIITVSNKKNIAEKVIANIFRFDIGYNLDCLVQNHGIKFAWTPGGTFLNDNLEIRFNVGGVVALPADTTDGKFNIFTPVNNNNNPWSFGSDYTDTPGHFVFDLFDDFLLKIDKIRYGHDTPKDKFFFTVGNYQNVSDRYDFSLSNFNSDIFTGKLANTSVAIKVNLSWFELFVYAENILPRGLYGTSVKFMTPNQSLKWKIGLSTYIDTYNLIHFGKNIQSYTPLQTNVNLEFSLLDLPTFGFDLYINAGLLFPFSYNFATNDSYFTSCANSANIGALFTNINANLGTSFKIKKIYLTPEFIVETALNRVGQFDIAYTAKKQKVFDKIESFLTKNNATTISDFYFGTRLKLKYIANEIFNMEMIYHISFAYNEDFAPEKNIYDKFLFSLNVHTPNSMKRFGFAFSLTYMFDEMISSIVIAATSATEPTNILQNMVAYTDITFSLGKIIDIVLRGGIRPSATNDFKGLVFFQSFVGLNIQ